jgi:hypothetical protein
MDPELVEVLQKVSATLCDIVVVLNQFEQKIDKLTSTAKELNKRLQVVERWIDDEDTRALEASERS